MLRLALCVLFACWAFAATAIAQEKLTSPPAIILAEVYRQSIDPAQYLVSEKYDGVRAIWDGRELRFRSGNRVHAPEWFINSLPNEALDGELWLGRGQFAELSAIVRRSEPVDAEWRQVRYMLFELPGATGSFEERVQRMQRLAHSLNLPWLQAVEQFRVADIPALIKLFKRMTREGAEGLMLHRADARYVTGRSDVLLKLKPLQDAEAVVTGYVAGKGKFQGMVGALIVATPEGKRFRIGSGLNDALRLNPPPVGTTITYRYQELSPAGIPRFARFWRVREQF